MIMEWFCMKLKITVIILVAFTFLAACNDQNDLKELNTNASTQDVKELVNEYSNGNFTDDETASITSTQLIVTDSKDNEAIYELPEDEFFVSIAPFINETHPCTNHSLTGCQGELTNEDFDIHIEDLEGNTIFEETMNSGENGFIDLWLPRDKTYQVKITQDGKEVQSELSTFENDGTCITTMQLS